MIIQALLTLFAASLSAAPAVVSNADWNSGTLPVRAFLISESDDIKKIQELKSELRHNSKHKKVEAATQLARLTWDIDAVRALAWALQHDEETDVRVAAARALGTILSKHAIGPLVASMKNTGEHALVRMAASHALREIVTFTDQAMLGHKLIFERQIRERRTAVIEVFEDEVASVFNQNQDYQLRQNFEENLVRIKKGLRQN